MATLSSLPNLTPGATALQESVERGIVWGENPGTIVLAKVILSSTTVDARSTVTTDLQPGLLLGKITASGKMAHYVAAAMDGTQTAVGALAHSVQMLNNSGVAAEQLAWMIVAGPLVESELGGYDAAARVDLANHIVWDTDY